MSYIFDVIFFVSAAHCIELPPVAAAYRRSLNIRAENADYLKPSESVAVPRGAAFGRKFTDDQVQGWWTAGPLPDPLHALNPHPPQQRRGLDSIGMSEVFRHNAAGARPAQGLLAQDHRNLHHPLLAGVIGMPGAPYHLHTRRWATSQFINQAHHAQQFIHLPSQMLQLHQLWGSTPNYQPGVLDPPLADPPWAFDGWVVFARKCIFPF